MRVLHVIDSLQVGGAETHLRNIIPQLRKKNIQISIYLLKSTKSFLELDIMKDRTPIYYSNRSSIYSIAHVFDLARHLRDHHYDLIHVHLFPAQLWAAMAVYLVRGKILLITTEHNTYNRRRKSWLRPLDRWMYKQYISIIAISEATANAMEQWLPELNGKITIIPNGIPLDVFSKASPLCKSEITGNDSSPIILCIARFEAQKDHVTILKAMLSIPEAHLVLVGDGLTRTNMEAFAERLGIKGRVHFLGSRQDIPQLIKMADIYVQSSHWEGFGLAAIEAMAGGLPIVASRVPGLMDIIGDAGMLFEPGDYRQLAACINKLIDNHQLCLELSEKSNNRSQNYSIEKTADNYAVFYNKCLYQ